MAEVEDDATPVKQPAYQTPEAVNGVTPGMTKNADEPPLYILKPRQPPFEFTYADDETKEENKKNALASLVVPTVNLKVHKGCTHEDAVKLDPLNPCHKDDSVSIFAANEMHRYIEKMQEYIYRRALVESTGDTNRATHEGVLNSLRNGDKERITELEATIKGLEATIKGLEATIKGHEATIKRLEATIKGHEATIKGLEATIKRHETTIGEMKSVICKRGRFVEILDSGICLSTLSVSYTTYTYHLIL